VFGTLDYMPPEQVKGLIDHIDHRSDIYSLGMTLYEMLAGRLPFERNENYYDLAKIIVEHEFFPPQQFNAAVPVELGSLVMQALAKNPADRFQSTAAMLAAIEKFEMAPAKTVTIIASIETAPLPPPPVAAGETAALSQIPASRFFIPSPEIPSPAPIIVEKPPRRNNRQRLLVALVPLSLVVITVVLVIGFDKLRNPLSSKEMPQPVDPQSSIDSTMAPALTHSALIKELAGITAAPALQTKLREYEQAMLIGVGSKEDFTPLEGCYVFVMDEQTVLGVFQYKDKVYYSVNSNENYAMLAERYAGKIARWVKDYSK